MNPFPGWKIPDAWTSISTVDAHVEGEPLRVIVGGYPELPGKTILARRQYAKTHLDHLRKALMWEPRGHADMYGCVLTSRVTPEADFGVLFLHNEGYSTMCGHGIIGVATVVLATGWLPLEEPETVLRIDTPAGLVTAEARVEQGRVRGVRFRNVPSFVMALDETVEVAGLGEVKYDLAFGGAFYAIVRARDVGLTCRANEYRTLIEAGMAIKRAITEARPVEHPIESDLSFLYGTIFTAPAQAEGVHSRNVCIFADGEVDRSPTGTGVSARAAIHYARGEVRLGKALTIESIIGSRFTVRILETTSIGPYQAVIPEVEGRAFITGRHTFLIDPLDSWKEGFILR